MSSSGAIKQQDFVFNYSFVKASDPTAFFTGTFASGEVLIHKRTAGTTTAGVPITNLPSQVGSSSVYQITLEGSSGTNETNCDEVIIEFAPATSDFIAENISISFETTASDVLKVQTSTVSGIADFKATGFSTFDAASDTVTTDAASRTASQANVSALATSAEIAALNNFDPATDTVANVTTVGSVTAAVTTDSASRTASQANVSALATSAEIAALNDIAATDIVSGGAITTSGGAVSNVTLVATTTTNTDMRGTDNAASQTSVNTVDTEVGQIKAKTDQLTFTVANQVDANALTGTSDATAANQTTIINHLTDVKGAGWTSTDNLAEITEDVTGLNGDAMRGTDSAYTGTPPTEAQIYAEFVAGSNEDAFKADVSNLATSAEISSLNDFDPATQSVTIQGVLGTLDQLDSQQDAQHSTTQAAIAALSDPTAVQIADAILSRNVSNVEATMDEHTLGTIVLCILESVRSGTNWEIKTTAGATKFTKTLTLQPGADPVVGVE